jgi:hypothetical protein
MQRYKWGFVLVALVTYGHTAHVHGQGYTYLETFDNDTDTFTPATTYGNATTPVATGSPPVDWQDGRPQWPSPPPPPPVHIVEEVPSGYNGVLAGPHGGDNMGFVFGAGNWRPSQSVPPSFPLGSVSFQIDFLSDQRTAVINAQHAMLMEFATLLTEADGGFSSMQFSDLYLFTFESSGQSGPSLLRYDAGIQNFVQFLNLPATPQWYTFEAYFKASNQLDPATGRPRLAEVFNLYKQARFENGFRQGELVASVESIRSVVAAPIIQPVGVFIGSTTRRGQFHYIDNVALGPVINTPEPAGGIAMLLGMYFGVMKRCRGKRSP